MLSLSVHAGYGFSWPECHLHNFHPSPLLNKGLHQAQNKTASLGQKRWLSDKYKVVFKVFMFEIYSRRSNSALLTVDPPACSSLGLLSSLYPWDWAMGMLPSFLQGVRTQFVVRLCFFVFLKGWVARALGIKGCFELWGVWLLKGGAFGHSQKVRLRVYLTVLSWVVVSALSLKDQAQQWFRAQELSQNSVCVTKVPAH